MFVHRGTTSLFQYLTSLIGSLEYQLQYLIWAQNRISKAREALRVKALTQACYLCLFFIFLESGKGEVNELEEEEEKGNKESKG